MRIGAVPGRLPGMNGESSTGAEPSPDLLLAGRYRLIRPMGAGGMAVVWEAWDDVLARTVAVKALAARFVGDPESRSRIRHEARAAAGLSHPNIAQVHDYGEAATPGGIFPYVVMELVQGGTLLERLSAGPMTPRFAMRVCAEVAAALAAAHADGIVHRDVKPANVMLAPSGAKVVDFGIAAAIAPGRTGEVDFEVLGTPAYLAPERLIDDVVEPASDVYALGIILYQLLADRSPWTSENTTQMLTAHIYIDPAPLEPMPGVPDYVTELCNRCLSKDPSMRPSAREAAAVLAQGARLRVVTDETPPGPNAMAFDLEPSVLVRPPREAPGPASPVSAPPVSAPPVSAPPVSAPPFSPEPAAASDAVTEPALAAPMAATGAPGPGQRTRIVRWSTVGAAILVGLAVAVWALAPSGRTAAGADLGLGVTPAATPSVSSAPAGVGPTPLPSGSLHASSPARGLNGTKGPGGAGTSAGHAAPRTSATRPAATGTATPTAPATTASQGPVERTLTSIAGILVATCPSADTAKILTAAAIAPFKLKTVDTTAGPSPAALFKNKSERIVMTVTCSSGIPSATSSSI